MDWRQRLASLPKQLGDRLVGPENEPDELHRHFTCRAPQRVASSGTAALLPGLQAHRWGLGLKRLGFALAEHGAGVGKVVLAPARGKQASVAHHLEVLVRNV